MWLCMRVDVILVVTVSVSVPLLLRSRLSVTVMASMSNGETNTSVVRRILLLPEKDCAIKNNINTL